MDASSDPAPVIDCDLHATVPSIDALVPYLPRYWREYIAQSSFKGPIDSPYPPAAATSVRPEFRDAAGQPLPLDLDHLRQHALDTAVWHTEIGLLNCSYGVESLHNPDAAAALSSAVNEWLLAEWLVHEPRLRAALVVPSTHPALAAREIDRLGARPGFVQVYLPARSAEPYGNRHYYPLYEAAVRHDLPLGIHFGGAPGTPPTPTGWPSTYIEEYAGMAQVFQSQVLSMVAEGVFETFPTLRVVLIEGGFTWLPSLMWRMDKEWKGMRREIPWVKRPPSEIIREHFRLTLQPLDAPQAPEPLRQTIEMMDSDDLLLFSTDYPHWHFDTPQAALPAGLPAPLRRKILSENARAFYRLGTMVSP
jgi:predicted TIM-barrel fold metal-dependent hydrolase